MQPPKSKGPWKCLDSDIEILKEKISLPGTNDSRALMKVNFSNKRAFFEQRRNKQFDQKFAEEEYKESHSKEDTNYDPANSRVENTLGIQAVPDSVDCVIQTPHYRTVDSAIQAEPTHVDARIKPDGPPADPTVKAFCAKVFPRVWHYLTLNVEIPLFLDDFTDLTDEDAIVGNRDDNNLKEFGTFQHHTYTFEKMITGIDWQPKAKGVVALSVVSPVPLEERHRQSRLVNSNLVVIWNFADPIHPLCVLESPVEVSCIRFNPTSNNLIVGGGFNGQVILWDISHVMDAAQKTTKKTRNVQQQHQEVDPTHIPSVAQGIPGITFDEDGDSKVMRIEPKLISKLESGHRRCVNDLWWLQDNMECTFEGKMTQNAEEKTLQFGTVSSDGSLCIWDIRPDNISKNKARKLQQSKKAGEVQWIPLHKIQLSRPEGGDIMALRFVMEGKSNPYLMCCTTEEGEFAVCNWCMDESLDKTATGLDANHRMGEMDLGMTIGGKNKIVKMCSMGHFGPSWSVQRHPAKELSDFYLTTGDWGFKIWKIGISQPVMSWCGENLITCGRWSPTRAAVMFLGTNDGVVQIWDLLDRSHEAMHFHALMGEPVTSLEFKSVTDTRRSKGNAQLVAAGTRAGLLHVLELPGVFQKPHANELKMMKNYLEREVRRVQYYTWRWKEVDRQKELDRGGNTETTTVKKPDGEDGEVDGDNEFKDELKFEEARGKFVELVNGKQAT